jgi:hypothetical protein
MAESRAPVDCLSLEELLERYGTLSAELNALEFLLHTNKMSDTVERQRFIDRALELPEWNSCVARYIRVHRLENAEQLINNFTQTRSSIFDVLILTDTLRRRHERRIQSGVSTMATIC